MAVKAAEEEAFPGTFPGLRPFRVPGPVFSLPGLRPWLAHLERNWRILAKGVGQRFGQPRQATEEETSLIGGEV